MIYLLAAIVFFEIFLILVVTYYRKEFQWLITRADEKPSLDKTGLKKFLLKGFDPYLGWSRKPNTSGTEKGKYGPTSYDIDNNGARFNPLLNYDSSIIATFGDSYTFCRQVNNDETWQYFLTKVMGAGVLNYGVGNYGADQALLRYEQMELPPSVKISVLEFVPETICRIHSYWKHYLEFGNTFAFKPRFTLKADNLLLCPNPISSKEDFEQYLSKLPEIRQIDGFYKSKFCNLQFRFPYTLSFLRNPKRNATLLFLLTFRKIARALNLSNPNIDNAPFGEIMRYNIKESYKMYSDEKARLLLKKILQRFVYESEKKGHKPLIVVMPQLIDLKFDHLTPDHYSLFFKQLHKEGFPVFDLTEVLKTKSFDKLYTEDLYGGHFSREGNEVIADILYGKITELFPLETGSIEQK